MYKGAPSSSTAIQPFCLLVCHTGGVDARVCARIIVCVCVGGAFVEVIQEGDREYGGRKCRLKYILYILMVTQT